MTTQLLLDCGAEIGEINCIRRHLSRSKGGGLARAASPATLISLILSDVVADASTSSPPAPRYPMTAASPMASPWWSAMDSRPVPAPVWHYLKDGDAGLHPETPKAGDPIFAGVQNVVVGNNQMALLAARDRAEALGCRGLVLTSALQGEAREVGRMLAALGQAVSSSDHPAAPPVCLLAGGETTVTLEGQGKGGRNQELALAAALALEGSTRISLLSAGTDGTDGPTDAAGAFADGATCRRARARGLDPGDFLSRHDSYPFFAALGDLLITGPTRTNVMDIICLLIE